MQNTVRRNTTETTQRIYEAQKVDTKKSDFFQLVQEDAQTLGIVINETEIVCISKYQYKRKCI